MNDIIAMILFGLFIMILAPAIGVGVAIIFGHLLFGKKKRWIKYLMMMFL